MRRLVDDDVRSRLAQVEARGLRRRNLRLPYAVEELTSRKSATDIPEVLERMKRKFPPFGQQANPQPIDVLLATNMLSVGVDVSRLGLMIVAGQPKATSEYIQATSRVGRGSAGLVLTVYNWARPRDLSHFEGFRHYHATFYRQVRQRDPALARRIIFITGDTVSPDTRAFLQRVSNPVLAKPFKIGPLRDAIEAVLSQ